MSRDEKAEIEALRAGLGKKPDELSLEALAPVFVPQSCMALGNWPGPYDVLGIPGLVLTWAVLQPGQTMRYVSRDVQAYWEERGIPWRERTMRNLYAQSAKGCWTHEFRRDDRTLFAVAMMHNDGIGPSRMLMHEELGQAFPGGYLVGLPEMSCGIVLSVTAVESEREKIVALVEGCFRDGTRPLIPGLHVPDSLSAMPPL